MTNHNFIANEPASEWVREVIAYDTEHIDFWKKSANKQAINKIDKILEV